ncbi:MAG: TonB-dependent receptor [Saprospiraceae bacterium]|nr:TonB-dependent receptor [Saprospiraceae bacterium]
MKKIMITSLIILFSGYIMFAQNPGTLKGQVFDKDAKISLPQATITIETKGKTIGAITNLDGYFTIKPLDPGYYDVQISYVGYQKVIIEKVKINPNDITYLKNINLPVASETLKGIVITAPYKEPIIRIDGASHDVIDGQVIGGLPERNDIPTILATISPKVIASDDGKKLYFRGSRDGDAVYFVDGVKLRNASINVPGGAIKSISVYSGGVPAKYGDFTGGAVVIETKGYFDWLMEARWRDQMTRKREAEKLAYKKEQEKKAKESL